jgi:predicted esterase YcpF (UPF0227 family)
MLPSANVIAEDLPLHPAEALALLRQLCETHHPDLIIGTSMGGMYTEQLYGYDRIVVNPAFQIADTMAAHGMMGQQEFFSPRKDGVQKFFVDKALVKEYKACTEQNFSGVTDEEKQRVWGLFGDEDDLVDTFDLFYSHYPQAAHFHGGHRMNDHIFLHNLIPLIQRIDDLQDHRERPVIFIGMETLIDNRGEATASAQKAFLHLQEDYQVFIVAPSPTNHPAYPEEVIRQAVQYYDSPAHDRVIFTNQRHLLYGDFLVADAPCDSFLGTVIPWRSNDFKTWEEIILYFDRLAGNG